MFLNLVEAIALHRKGIIDGAEFFIFPPDFNPSVFPNHFNPTSHTNLTELFCRQDLCNAMPTKLNAESFSKNPLFLPDFSTFKA